MRKVPISCGFLAFSTVAATRSRVRIVWDILLSFVNGSEALAVTRRDKDATWCTTGTLCRQLDWSRLRLLHELKNGLPYRTISKEYVVDWHDPHVRRKLNVEASEVQIYDA